jgi:hypothetical protein
VVVNGKGQGTERGVGSHALPQPARQVHELLVAVHKGVELDGRGVGHVVAPIAVEQWQRGSPCLQAGGLVPVGQERELDGIYANRQESQPASRQASKSTSSATTTSATTACTKDSRAHGRDGGQQAIHDQQGAI